MSDIRVKAAIEASVGHVVTEHQVRSFNEQLSEAGLWVTQKFSRNVNDPPRAKIEQILDIIESEPDPEVRIFMADWIQGHVINNA